MPRSINVELITRSAADVLRAGCAESIEALKKYHIQALRFQPEPIHQMRVGTRRLRAILNVFSSVMDEEWAMGLESELRWLAHVLGTVRDLDVLQSGLKALAREGKPAVRTAVKSIDRILAARHRDAKLALKEVLESERYEGLLVRLHEGQLAPQLTLEGEASALETLLPELRKAWKKVVRAADKLKSNDQPVRFHSVRKLGKRIRYATEMIEQDFDVDDRKTVQKFIKQLKKLQDALGAFQDATIAIATVEALEERKSTKLKSYGFLIDREKELQKKARQKFPKAWKNARESGNKKWMNKK